MSREIHERYAPAEALKRIKSNLSNGELLPTKHFTDRIMERGIDMQDVLNALKQGIISTPAEPHPKTGRWIYNVEGKTIEGKALKISVDIDDNKNVLVTAFCKEG